MDTEIKKQASGLYGKIISFLKKWKFPLLIMLLGALLVLWPGIGTDREQQRQEEKTAVPTQTPVLSYAEQTEQRLCEVLSSVDGAGRVEVMLTVRGSDVTFFQTDTDTSTEKNGETSKSSTRYETVILSGGGEYDKPAVVKTEYPAFEGALIVSEGADIASVRLSLVSAVSSLLGLGADKITVVKMK